MQSWPSNPRALWGHLLERGPQMMTKPFLPRHKVILGSKFLGVLCVTVGETLSSPNAL